MRRALGNGNSELCHWTTQSIDDLGFLSNEKVTYLENRRRSLLFLAFNCDETHSWSHSRLADRFRIGRIVLLALYERLDVN